MDNLRERFFLPEFLKNNEPQMNTDKRRFNNRISSFIHALKSVFAPLCVLCGEIKICTAKSAKNAKEGAINGCSCAAPAAGGVGMEKHVEYAELFDAPFTNFGINAPMPMFTESELNDFFNICGTLEKEIYVEA